MLVKYLQEGISPERFDFRDGTKETRGLTPLMIAAKYGWIEISQ